VQRANREMKANMKLRAVK